MKFAPLSAAALLAMAPALGLAEASVYGSIRLVLHSPAGDDRDTSVDNSASRFGLRGSEEIGDGLKIGGRYEFGVSADQADLQEKNRLSYISIEGAFGELQVGRVWSTYWNINGLAWQSNEFGADGNSTTLRTSDSIKWTKAIGNASLSAMVQMEDGLQRAQGSAIVSLGSLQLGAGFDRVTDEVAEAPGAAGDGNAEDDLNTALSVSWSAGAVGLNAVFNNKDNGVDDAVVGYSLNAVYSANDNTFVLSLGDPDTDFDDDESVSFELARRIGDRSRAFLSVQNSDPGTGVMLGLRHDW